MSSGLGSRDHVGKDQPGSLALCSGLRELQSCGLTTPTRTAAAVPWRSFRRMPRPSLASSSFRSFLTCKAELGRLHGLLWAWL